jgi:hypothetical protein
MASSAPAFTGCLSGNPEIDLSSERAVHPQVFELTAARAFWRRLERNGIVATSVGASMFLAGATLVIARGRQSWDFRVQIALLFIGAAAFILALAWTPLGPQYATRRAPNRLAIDDEEVLLEVVNGPPTRMGWNDPGFQLSLWSWPPGLSSDPPFRLDIGRYSGIPIGAEPYEAVRSAVVLHHCAEEATTFRLPLGRKGTVSRITYRRPVGPHDPGADRLSSLEGRA